jgi:hypothetical protein
MSFWLTSARNLLIAWAALTLFAWLATELIATLFGFDPRLGGFHLTWYGLPLYDPWDFLGWGFAMRAQPWGALFSLALAGIVGLAAFAALVLARLIPPVEPPRFKLRRGLATWDMLGQQGLLAGNGLALGAVRRHCWAKPAIVSAPAGSVLIVGDPNHSDDTLLAAISAWRGSLVFVDARDLALRLPRAKVLRFAPGRADSASYNPLLAIRDGAHAWADAHALARSLLQAGDEGLSDAFAVLMLDQLLSTPLEQRNLAAIRQRLAEPHRVLVDICATWVEPQLSAPAPLCEIARAVQAWRVHPSATLGHLAAIDAALAVFADGGYMQATTALQFRFADLVAGGDERTLVISPPPGQAHRGARLVAAMLAQLVAECAAAPDIDHCGRTKKHQLLIVIDAEMNAALGAALQLGPVIPMHASRNGCHCIIQAHGMEHSGVFDAIVAIGPQSEAAATQLSLLAGQIPVWTHEESSRSDWRSMVFPSWERSLVPILSQQDLVGAHADAAFIFLKNMAPIRASALHVDAGHAAFTSGAELAPAAHDWSAPPLERAQVTTSAAATPAVVPPLGARVRKLFARTAPPASRTKAKGP